MWEVFRELCITLQDRSGSLQGGGFTETRLRQDPAWRRLGAECASDLDQESETMIGRDIEEVRGNNTLSVPDCCNK